MSESLTWKSKLGDAVDPALSEEIDTFEKQLGLMWEGKIDDKLFIETRLRRGVYGQRYDNGQRHDGTQSRTIPFPSGERTKGPLTMWDAPGMMRIKIPFGHLTADQLDCLSDLAEEYSDQILHITTRQDIQLHFIHVEDTIDIMRRLGAVGITTREACGNSVRNVTACQFAGTCNTESFDVTPYAHAYTHYFLGHPDIQDFGRKFKVAFSGCHDHGCGLTNFHDLGATAQMKDGKRGFRVVIGGGLGAVPQHAKVLHEWLPEEELLAWSQAVFRVFARLGEKNSRAKARIKFLVKKLGIDEFKRIVTEEREKLRHDDGWTSYLDHLHYADNAALKPGSELPEGDKPEGFDGWLKSNIREQAQPGYAVATVTCPLGDFTPDQGRALSAIARKYTGDAIRLTVEQNLVFRWVSKSDLPALYADLKAVGLGDAGATGITDITACPGTDTCKLGISASRGLATEVTKRLRVVQDELPPEVKKLRIKASGCFNSCGQHHVADLGFLGVSRVKGGRRVPHFNLVLGGEWENNGGSYGLVMGSIPSKNVPDAIDFLTKRYVDEREGNETLRQFVMRKGKGDIKKSLKPLMHVPDYEEDPSYYADWGDPREYTIGDIGVGECAGEIVPFAEFGLQAAEQEVFDAQLKLDAGKHIEAASEAFNSMCTAAKALVRHTGAECKDDHEDIVTQFKTHLFDTKVFFDPFAKGKFGSYLFKIHEEGAYKTADREVAHQIIEEATLFIEAAHACYQRMATAAMEAAE